MNRLFTILFIIPLLSIQLYSQSDSLIMSSIVQANDLYKAGQYTDAAKVYEEILKSGVSAELYYNLGNSYYKIDEIGLAILNYERALRINPRFKNAAYNLQIAEDKVVDNVSTSPAFFIKRWLKSLISTSTSNQWTYISLVFFILTLSSFLFFLFSVKRSRRKLSFYTIIIAAVLFIITFYFSAIRKEQFIKHNTAIILAGTTTAKSAPDNSGTDLFQLHEGTRVTVKSTLGTWVEITLENGAVGWLEEKAMERI